MGISPEDYPEIPVVEGINNISLPQKILKSMINQTIFAVSESEVRPIYTGVLFEIDGDTLTLVAVDGYRLAKRCERIEGAKLENCTFVVPGSSLTDIERISAPPCRSAARSMCPSSSARSLFFEYISKSVSQWRSTKRIFIFALLLTLITICIRPRALP